MLLTLPENLRVGKIGKPKSRKRGWGEAEFLYLYYSTIICNGGQRGWGSWGRLLCLVHLACRSSAPPPSCYPSPDKPTAFFNRYWFFSSGDIMLSAKWSLAAERAVSFMVCDTFVLSIGFPFEPKALVFTPLAPSSSDPNWFTPKLNIAFDAF